MLAEKEFQKLDMISSYGEKVEPIKYILKLCAGIFFAFMSVLSLTHWFAYIAIRVDDKPVRPVLNYWLESIEQSPVAFLASVLFVLFGYYLVACTIKGNVKFGIRFFFITFYPIVPKETFVNSFLANCLVLNVVMVALT